MMWESPGCCESLWDDVGAPRMLQELLECCQGAAGDPRMLWEPLGCCGRPWDAARVLWEPPRCCQGAVGAPGMLAASGQKREGEDPCISPPALPAWSPLGPAQSPAPWVLGSWFWSLSPLPGRAGPFLEQY